MKDPNPIRERVEEAIVRLSLEHPELGTDKRVGSFVITG